MTRRMIAHFFHTLLSHTTNNWDQVTFLGNLADIIIFVRS